MRRTGERLGTFAACAACPPSPGSLPTTFQPPVPADAPCTSRFIVSTAPASVLATTRHSGTALGAEVDRSHVASPTHDTGVRAGSEGGLQGVWVSGSHGCAGRGVREWRGGEWQTSVAGVGFTGARGQQADGAGRQANRHGEWAAPEPRSRRGYHAHILPRTRSGIFATYGIRKSWFGVGRARATRQDLLHTTTATAMHAETLPPTMPPFFLLLAAAVIRI